MTWTSQLIITHFKHPIYNTTLYKGFGQNDLRQNQFEQETTVHSTVSGPRFDFVKFLFVQKSSFFNLLTEVDERGGAYFSRKKEGSVHVLSLYTVQIVPFS